MTLGQDRVVGGLSVHPLSIVIIVVCLVGCTACSDDALRGVSRQPEVTDPSAVARLTSVARRTVTSDTPLTSAERKELGVPDSLDRPVPQSVYLLLRAIEQDSSGHAYFWLGATTLSRDCALGIAALVRSKECAADSRQVDQVLGMVRELGCRETSLKLADDLGRIGHDEPLTNETRQSLRRPPGVDPARHEQAAFELWGFGLAASSQHQPLGWFAKLRLGVPWYLDSNAVTFLLWLRSAHLAPDKTTAYEWIGIWALLEDCQVAQGVLARTIESPGATETGLRVEQMARMGQCKEAWRFWAEGEGDGRE